MLAFEGQVAYVWPQKTMTRKERNHYKELPDGKYHFCLDRLEDRWLFHSAEDYRLGMASIALAVLKFGIIIYVFELMPNHLHIILAGTGRQCLQVFSFIKRRLSERLLGQGYAALPLEYGFKLIPIPDDDALRSQILYTVRNPYEKGYCVPGGHKWGSGYLYFNELAALIKGEKVSQMHIASVRRAVGSNETLSADWEIHPELGVLPRNFVRVDLVEKLFSSAKEYQTRLIKEYETVVKIARTLNEEVDFSEVEVRDIVNTELRNSYPGRLFKNISQEEKCRVAVRLNEMLGLSTLQLSRALFLSELTISQAIRSKDYGIK